MMPSDVENSAAGWSQLFRIAGVIAIILATLIPLQVFLFIAFPPPKNVLDYFGLFQSNKVLGLIDLDILLSLDNLLLIAIYLALYAALKRVNKSLMTIALAIGLVSITLYLVSREVTFSMLSLSSQYATAATEIEKAALAVAGQTLLTIYNGGSFATSYVLGGITVLLISFVALRGDVLGKDVAVVGLVTGIMMLLPPTAGTVAAYVSFLSLIPLFVWLVLLAGRFLRLSQKGSKR